MLKISATITGNLTRLCVSLRVCEKRFETSMNDRSRATMASGVISVVVPVYNSAMYLDKCIQSILKQSYPNWELIL